MTSKSGVLVAALVCVAIRGAWPGDAAANAYQVVVVSVDRLTEQYGPDLQGVYSGAVTTSSLPGPLLNQTSGSYTQVSPNAIGGSWKLSDGGLNAIGGSFEMLNRNYAAGFARTSGTITLDNAQSAGVYSNVNGGGSLEAFTHDAYDQILGQPYIQRVTIARLQFTADGPVQTDNRNVLVAARVGFNNDNTHHGMNVGVPTSDSVPLIVTSVRAEYDYTNIPVQGQGFARNDAGDSQHWSYEVDPASGQDLGGFLFHYFGPSTFLEGTGVYAGNVGSAEWESFQVGTGLIAPNVYTDSVISIDRYTLGPVTAPVPEPQTYVLMLAGMGLVGAMAIRRRNPL